MGCAFCGFGINREINVTSGGGDRQDHPQSAMGVRAGLNDFDQQMQHDLTEAQLQEQERKAAEDQRDHQEQMNQLHQLAFPNMYSNNLNINNQANQQVDSTQQHQSVNPQDQ
ncbi:hypothetical protein OXYTRIMIC_625 [Oxytricha trifallax]|uniref:Uncharacterized protein n=1 Tax=Oxytricha trifallax TaxID=1172189 RepID=A0A073HXN2_9SPIT|nr:hypothetical protein OXYTRIMIC_625 [Oxytricha trifallax]